MPIFSSSVPLHTFHIYWYISKVILTEQKDCFSLILNSVKKEVCFYPMCLFKMGKKNPLLQLKNFYKGGFCYKEANIHMHMQVYMHALL